MKLSSKGVIYNGGDELFTRRKEFHRRLGFQRSQDRSERMLIAIDTVRAMFSN